MSSYAETVNRLADFEVSYRFLSEFEGGRKTGPPFQHYRCDWTYEGDDISKTGVYAIWPEFLDSEGNLLTEKAQVSESGKATMWIVVAKMIPQVHGSRIKIGTKGFSMEGARRVAEAVVTRVIGLHTNTI
jgi:hypothetical protein